MKLNIRTPNQIYNDRRSRMKAWQLWFAWRPVRLNHREVVWLEKVYRRHDYYGSMEYKTKEAFNNER
jgi:hypothetical protein